MTTLRPFSRNDAEYLQSRYYPDMPVADVGKMIDDWNTCSYQGHYYKMYAILHGKRMAGYVSLLEHSRNVVSIGVEVNENERRNGIALEAVAQVMRHASEKGYHIILDQVRKDNQASIRLHEKLGFESDGYVYRNRRDHEVVLYLKFLG